MAFYQELSKVYELVFPLSNETLNFIENNLKKGSKVLDLACGSGEYSIRLSKDGYEVYALDLDEAMILKLTKKAEDNGLSLTAVTGDMLQAKELVPSKLQGIFCIGNSLVHLTSTNKIGELLNKLYSMLLPDGILIIQILNYDRILDQRISKLPEIKIVTQDSKEISFKRFYSFPKDSITISFDTLLKIKENNNIESFENSIPLLPLRSLELHRLLTSAGFKNIELYGSFSGEAFEKEKSFPLIIKAAK